MKNKEPTRRPSLKPVKSAWRKLRIVEDQDLFFSKYSGRDSSVGIATRYGLDGARIESRPNCPGTHPASYTMGTGSFPGGKRPGRGADHPPPSSAEVEERVELYFHSPSGPLWPVIGRTYLYLYLYCSQYSSQVPP